MNDFELEPPLERGDESLATTCEWTGVYQSACACRVRTAFAAGDPFTPCPACGHGVEWRLLGGNGAP